MKKTILVLIIIGIIIRLFGVNLALYEDETAWTNAILSESIADGTEHIFHPPLTPLLYRISLFIFGLHVWSLRLAPFIFSILGIFIIYLISRMLYNHKAAFFSVFIMAFSFYSILASLEIDHDGFLLFLYPLCFYCFLKYEREKIIFWNILTSLVLGISLMAKFTTVLLLFCFGLYKLIISRSIKETIKSLFIPALVVILTFILYYALSMLIDPRLFYNAIHHSAIDLTVQGITRANWPFMSAIPVIYLWATPFLIGLFILSLFNPKKEDYLFVIWVIVLILFHIFILKNGDFSRYLIVSLISFSILGGKLLSSIKWNTKEKVLAGVSFFIFLVCFLSLNLVNMSHYTHFFGNYLSSAKSLNFNFFFPYVVSSGSWFGVNFLSVLIISIVCLSLIPSFYWIINHGFKVGKLFLIIFLGASFAFNIFLVEEYLFKATQPDPSKAVYALTDYFKQNSLKYPVYTTNKGMLFHINHDFVYKQEAMNRIDEENIDILRNKIRESGATILYLNFAPYLYLDDVLDIDRCSILEKFYSKGKEIGYIIDCK